MAEPVRPARKRMIPWLIRVGVSLLVLLVLFRLVPPGEIVASARSLSPALWVGSLFLFLAGHVIAALKWRLLIGGVAPVGATLRAHFAGLSANIALPGVAGGDVARAALIARFVPSKARLATGSLMDRLIDTLGLLLIALISSWLMLADRDIRLRGVLLVAIVGAVGGGVVALAASRSLARWLAGRPRSKVTALFGTILNSLAEFAAEPLRLLLCLVLSLAVQCLFVWINIAIARDVGLSLPAAAWFEAWSLAKVIAILPISFGGLGVREASMAALLKPIGAPPDRVVAVGLIWQTILFASGFLGIAMQAIVARTRRPAPAPNGAEVPL